MQEFSCIYLLVDHLDISVSELARYKYKCMERKKKHIDYITAAEISTLISISFGINFNRKE